MAVVRVNLELHAAQALEWSTITARILPDGADDNEARLAEIDENLQRSDLSPAERAAHIFERKRIYEEIHGPAKANSARAANQAQGRGRQDVSDNLSFTSDTATKTGQNVKTVQRDAKRGATIGTETLAKVVGTSLDKGEELDALAQLDAKGRPCVGGLRISGQAKVGRECHDRSPDSAQLRCENRPS